MRIIAFLLLLATWLNGIDLNYFNNSFHQSLGKDQQMVIVVTDKDEEKLLIFRWTLFHNKGLVTLLNYNGEPSQHLLYKRYQQNSIKVKLALRQNESSRQHPYLLINFLGYNYENKRADFEILHKDPSGLTTISLKN